MICLVQPAGEFLAKGLVPRVGAVLEGWGEDGGIGEDFGCGRFEEGSREKVGGGPAAEEVDLFFGGFHVVMMVGGIEVEVAVKMDGHSQAGGLV